MDKWTRFVVPGNPTCKVKAEDVRLAIMTQRSGGKIAGKVCVDFRFCFPVPESVRGKCRADMLAQGVPHTKKPDFDNLAKPYCEAITGEVLESGAQVVCSLIVKQYSDEPRTEIYVSELDVRDISRLYYGRVASSWPASPDEVAA
ncbi:hypothetical protein JCM15519_03320 [Fundidesulfovibrio butyratiphilus]